MSPLEVPRGQLSVVIVDNGGANTASLQFALARLNCNARVTADADVIRQATHVLLPGVGAAADAMRRLRSAGLDALLPRLTQPVLGICLGMQLLYEASEEGETQCLAILPGEARRFIPERGRPVPHMGWNTLHIREKSPLLARVRTGVHAYFVHSYAVPVGPETLASMEYGNWYSAVVSHGNFFGTQFHPERSGALGAEVLTNFLEAG